MARLLIRLYRILLSPYLGHSCRFIPTCSQYADEAFKKHGFFKGLYLSAKRILKCNPWGPSGIDNVP